MDSPAIIAALALLAAALIGALVSKLFRPGIFLIFAQTFVSSAFVSVSVLHLIPDAVALLPGSYPLYSPVILLVFSLFSIGEFSTIRPRADPQQEGGPIQEVTIDYSIFLMHHFTSLPSIWLRAITFICFIGHSVVLGFAFSFYHQEHPAISVSLVLFLAIEKFLESFTVTLMYRAIANQFLFWSLIGLYSIVTPITIFAIQAANLRDNRTWSGVCLSISAGVFIFIGLLLWRRTFLTPFDWKKPELVVMSVLFVLGAAVPALTRLA
jgi:zinc transporter ZupT